MVKSCFFVVWTLKIAVRVPNPAKCEEYSATCCLKAQKGQPIEIFQQIKQVYCEFAINTFTNRA